MTTKIHSTPDSETVSQRKNAQPPRYHVIMHNDDYTTMEFVIEMLRGIFRKSSAEATHLMLMIHTEGQAVCGCYTYEIAETKIAQAHRCAKNAGHPLRCSMDRA
ncbi:MAG: ATP-dependent Clp protease adaptor ClpS [Thermodesulfobacteriota bacterium]|nr:ATP-dependent Clp protease adaptor ClpS [Thermodesulfobacteriota bacterium]